MPAKTWREFIGQVPVEGPKPKRALPDPGAAPDADGRGGRCAQSVPARGARRQEGGVPAPAPPPVRFEPGRGTGVEPEGELTGISGLSRLSGISRGTLHDWMRCGWLPTGTHEQAGDKRRGPCWSAPELEIIMAALHEVGLIERDRKFRTPYRTRVRPGDTELAKIVAKRMSEFWASQARGDPRFIQAQGDCRVIELPEIHTERLAEGDRQHITGPRPRPAEPPVVRDARNWRPAGQQPAPSARRPHRWVYRETQAVVISRPAAAKGSSGNYAPLMPRNAGSR